MTSQIEILILSLTVLLIAVWILAMVLGTIDSLDFVVRGALGGAALGIIVGIAAVILLVWRQYREGEAEPDEENGAGGGKG